MKKINSIDWLTLAGMFVAALLVAYASAETPAPKTVPAVDLGRYTGTWYEIARYPNRFERATDRAITATYTLRPDGKIDVLNRSLSPDGTPRSAHGWARVADRTTNSKLRVTFFWPFFGDYWILELGPQYEYAVVGGPDRRYLWVLSRTPKMDEKLYQQLLLRVTEQGYDPAKLIRPRQAG
jgi:apolipoprotein D and lipocalin family protein